VRIVDFGLDADELPEQPVRQPLKRAEPAQ
jgi:hypothetical protein